MNDYRAQLFSEKPLDWRIDRLGNLFKEREEKGYSDLPLLAVTGGSGITPRDQLNRRDTSSEDKSKYRLLKVGDIAYNTMRLWQGVLGLSQHEGIVSPAYTVLQPQDGVHAPFFYYLMKTPWMINSFLRYSSGLCSDTNNCKYESFKLIKTLVPSLPEQRKIADILGSMDGNIEKTQTLIAKLQDLKKATMQELLTKGIGHTEFKDSPVGRIPKEWKILKLGELAYQFKGLVQTGPFGSQLHACEYTDTGVPVIMPQDIDIDGVHESNIARVPENRARTLSRHRVKENDVVFARRGDLSRCAVICGRSVGWICGTGCFLVRIPANVLLGQWLSYIYRQDITQIAIANEAVGSTMVNLNTTILKDMLLPLPSLAEQGEIVCTLNSITGRIRSRQQYLSRLDFIKKALMQDLLTGKVRVKA